MFAVIYRGFVCAGKEQAYEKEWKKIACYFINHCGALGSVLHKTLDGEYIAYSRWPSKEMRDRSWGDGAHISDDSIADTIQFLKNCIDTSKPCDEILLNVVEDFLS